MFEDVALTLQRHRTAAERRWTSLDPIEVAEAPSHE